MKIKVGNSYINDKSYDIDTVYDTDLQKDLLTLYKRGWLEKLVIGKDLYDYLCVDGTDIRLGCDTIGNVRKFEYFLKKDEWEKYLKLINTIGAKIIFPKHKKINNRTLNQIRGCDSKIDDRFDLTLECIRLYYKKTKETYPLKDILKANSDFFDLFYDFKNYVKFFFLDDCLVDEDNNIKFFIDEKFENPTPFDKKEILYLKTVEFIKNRNEKIKRFIDNN